MSLYTKALSFAVNGYSIIPLKKDKRPLVSSWIDFQKKPATDDIIEQWWEQYPDANIGIVTGKISGITVVDIDVKGDTVVPLETFPETYTVKTPSGGYHLYYQYDPAIKQTANTYPQFPHVDIRNDGGYVVGPYSDNGAGGEYEIVNNKTPQKFPQSLFLEGKKKRTKKHSSFTEKLVATKALKDGDGRNNAMCSLLGSMLKGQLITNYPTIRESFFMIASAADNPLPRVELEKIWESIGKRAIAEAGEIDFMCNPKGVAYTNLENIKKVFSEDEQFYGRCVFDSFLQTYQYRSHVGEKYREMRDSDEVTLTREISMKYQAFAMVSQAMVRAVMLETAQENAVDCAKDWLTSLEWDGVARVDSWLHKVYNVDDNEYHRAVGSNWLKGLVRRIVSPGCKFDYVLVLEGKQGARKSTSLGVLGGDWHIETTASADNKDFLMLLQGNLIIEFSEGETLSRGEIKQLKALITTQYDKYRAPYERNVQTHPRRCVFAMTTNQTEYLKDETGNRRWLPVATKGDANIEWLRTNRDQLLAEALHRVRVLKETTYEFPESVQEEQSKRQVSDPNRDAIVEWYGTELNSTQRDNGVTTRDAYVEALGMGNKKLNKKDEMEIANIYRHELKLVRRQVVNTSGVRVSRWFDPDTVISGPVLTSKEHSLAY